MVKHFSYIYVERNMGSGYSTANAPCPFRKRWLFRHYLYPLAAAAFSKLIDRLGDDSVRKAETLRIGLQGDWSFWHGYYVSKYERQPDERCNDPLAKGRNPRFTMYIVLEGGPQLDPFARLYKFVSRCIATADEVMTPGINECLKIEIPAEFFEGRDE